ncbi:MAG: hypothetical protein JNG90_19070 [Planctomycetaceae bacterium]|nr:hypothetical protein [Planctomycetaceae bacterium]
MCTLLCAGWLLLGGNCARGADRVELEIVTEAGGAITAGQEWAKLFGELNLSGVQIRGSRPGDKVDLRVSGSPGSRVYHVVGVLTSRNELLVPGKRFRPSDSAAIADWLTRLAEDGPGQPGDEEVPFGLKRDQYVSLRRSLGRPVAARTLEQGAAELADELNRTAGDCFQLTTGARRQLAGAGPWRDELQGLAVGTALAAVLRSEGLGGVPRRGAGTQVICTVSELDENHAAWPVGFNADARRRELLPILFEFLNAEIEGASVAETIDSVAPRLGVPVLYDRLALEIHGIDPAQVEASLPAKRTSYSLLLQKVLFQARLKYELRVDDAGKPFLWITTIKKV